jgi:hypothetical protein
MNDRREAPQIALPEGLCAACRFRRLVRSDRGSTFVLCELSQHDARFARYPRLPVLRCDGYVPRDAAEI